MSRKLQPLPEYQSLIRWSVQDVVNWLSQNNLSECTRSFRHGGVDGNKLVNVTDTDLNNINCPKRHIQDILKVVSQVVKPGFQAKRGGAAWRQQAPKMPPNEQVFHDKYPMSRTAPSITNQDSASGSEDEGQLWDEDEWDDSFSSSEESYETPVDTSQPIAPPRPSRGFQDMAPSRPGMSFPQHQPSPKIPSHDLEEFYEDPDNPVSSEPQAPQVPKRPPQPIPAFNQDDGEDYEDPDKTVHIQNFHGGPLPTPPSDNDRKKIMPIGQRVLPLAPGSIPTLPSRPGTGPALPGRAGTGPSLPARSPQATTRVLPTANNVDEEDYEEPDNQAQSRRPLPPPISSVPSFRQKAPAIIPDDQEEYEEPDVHPQPPPVSSVPLHRRTQAPPVEPEEEYEDPDKPVMQARPPPIGQRKPPSLPGTNTQASRTSKNPPVPGSIPHRKPEPVVQEETYEVVDDTDSQPKTSKHPSHPRIPLPEIPQQNAELYEVPEKNNDEDSENYLAMDEGDSFLEKANSKIAPSMQPRRQAMPLPGGMSSGRKAAPVIEEQETYEIPDHDTSSELSAKKPGISNGGSYHRPSRTLPDLPQEPTQHKIPSKPSTNVSQPNVPKEFTEADLLRQKWYHGSVTRQEGDRLLNQYCENGMYFIRKSSQGGDKPYTLQIYYENKIYNLPIRKKTDGNFAIGKDEKPNEKTFESLLRLINAFKKNTIVLAGGKQTKLVKSLPKT